MSSTSLHSSLLLFATIQSDDCMNKRDLFVLLKRIIHKEGVKKNIYIKTNYPAVQFRWTVHFF